MPDRRATSATPDGDAIQSGAVPDHANAAATPNGRHAVVTGAFSNIGGAVATALLARGWRVTTLTNREPGPGDDPRIERAPLVFDREALRDPLAGADVFVNTYWVRFPFRGMTFERAIANSQALIDAARDAGIARFVQVSVSNANPDSPLGYYSGKAAVEQALRESGLGYGIVRPTLVVGPNDVLTNNIAWFLRRFPVIALPTGDGYLLQPVTLTDVGRIVADAVEAADNVEVDAAGPDQLTFRQYLELLSGALHRPARFVPMPATLMTAALSAVGLVLRDIVLTREELAGLATNMLLSHEPPLGHESVIDWINEHGGAFGARYMNDTKYRFRHAAVTIGKSGKTPA